MRISCPRPIIIYLKRVRIARNEDTQKNMGWGFLFRWNRKARLIEWSKEWSHKDPSPASHCVGWQNQRHFLGNLVCCTHSSPPAAHSSRPEFHHWCPQIPETWLPSGVTTHVPIWTEDRGSVWKLHLLPTELKIELQSRCVTPKTKTDRCDTIIDTPPLSMTPWFMGARDSTCMHSQWKPTRGCGTSFKKEHARPQSQNNSKCACGSQSVDKRWWVQKNALMCVMIKLQICVNDGSVLYIVGTPWTWLDKWTWTRAMDVVYWNVSWAHIPPISGTGLAANSEHFLSLQEKTCMWMCTMVDDMDAKHHTICIAPSFHP